MQPVLAPAETITFPVEPNPPLAVHLMPTPAQISQTIISRSFCATASKITTLDQERSNTQLSGIFFFIISKNGLKLVNQDWPKKRKKVP